MLKLNLFSPQLPNVALMEHYVWLVDLWTVLAGWRSVSVEGGGQCVILDGIIMMLKLCADNLGTVLTQVEFLSLHNLICILVDWLSHLFM